MSVLHELEKSFGWLVNHSLQAGALVLLVLLPLPFALLVGVYTGRLDQLGLLDLLDSFASRLLHTALITAVIAPAYLGLKVIIEPGAAP